MSKPMKVTLPDLKWPFRAEGVFFAGMHIPVDPPIEVFPGDSIKITFQDGTEVILE